VTVAAPRRPGDRPDRFVMSVVQPGDTYLVPPEDIEPVES
jgi:hypothetical protein